MGGTMLDAVIARYNVTTDESMRSYAERVYAGLRLCATVSKRRGFLARNVSPIDGVTHYSNVSRDQYTHCVYGLFRYYDSSLSSHAVRAEIRKILTSFAVRCKKDVTPKNDWRILREDGLPSHVCKMWGEVAAHEWFRLPMIYAAAWHVTGQKRWEDEYKKYRDEALANSAAIDCGGYEHAFALFQMINSLRLAYDADPDPEFKGRCAALMNAVADYCQKRALKIIADNSNNSEFAERLSQKCIPWDAVLPGDWTAALKARYAGIVGGRAYYIPAQWIEQNPAAWTLADAAYSVLCAALCPRPVADSLTAAVSAAAALVDYSRHYTPAPLFIAAAHWLCRENLNTEK
jgi:hypothetical protein